MGQGMSPPKGSERQSASEKVVRCPLTATKGFTYLK